MSRRKKRILAGTIVVGLVAAAATTLWQSGWASPALWLALAAAGLVTLLIRQDACQDFIAWREDFGVGYPPIDRDHQKLLSLINNLLAAQRCDTGCLLERQALDELLDYTEYHFQREEALMIRHGYADFEVYKAQHDHMRNQVKRHLERYREHGRSALPPLVNHLKVWLLQHIAGTDRRLAPFLAERARAEDARGEA